MRSTPFEVLVEYGTLEAHSVSALPFRNVLALLVKPVRKNVRDSAQDRPPYPNVRSLLADNTSKFLEALKPRRRLKDLRVPPIHPP
jgi:hypothetical protein